MTGYILSIAGVVLLSALVAMIAPSGKMGEFLKGVTKLVTLFILLAPIGKLAAGDEFIFSVGKIETDEAYLAYCAQELSAQDEAEIVLWLDETYDPPPRRRGIRLPQTFQINYHLAFN